MIISLHGFLKQKTSFVTSVTVCAHYRFLTTGWICTDCRVTVRTLAVWIGHIGARPETSRGYFRITHRCRHCKKGFEPMIVSRTSHAVRCERKGDIWRFHLHVDYSLASHHVTRTYARTCVRGHRSLPSSLFSSSLSKQWPA